MDPVRLDKESEQRALGLHRESLVIDCHSDIHLDMIRSRGRGENRVLERRYLPRWKEAGLKVVVLNTLARFGPDPYPYHTSPVHSALLMIDAIQQEIAESSDHFFQVLDPDDISRAQKEGKIGILFGLEGAEPVERDLGLLRCYYRLGLRIMNLTWHQRNLAADGVAEPSNSGLSNFGRTLVREMNRLGIIIDLSHLSESAVREVLELSEQPVIASHSNTVALYDHPRNLDDWQIEAIAEKGGMIGVVFLGRFVARESPNIHHLLDHLDHIATLVGPEHVGIGCDYTDFCADMIISSQRIAGPSRAVDDTEISYAEGLEDVTKLPNLTRGLISRGYRDNEIRGILGENFLELFRRVSRKEGIDP